LTSFIYDTQIDHMIEVEVEGFLIKDVWGEGKSIERAAIIKPPYKVRGGINCENLFDRRLGWVVKEDFKTLATSYKIAFQDWSSLMKLTSFALEKPFK